MRRIFTSIAVAAMAFGGVSSLGAPAFAKDVNVTFDRMAYFDMDGDGRVSQDEFWLSAPEFSGPVFIYADLDNDGFLNKRELNRAERRIRRNESRGRRYRR